jgi:hypothetical protein
VEAKADWHSYFGLIKTVCPWSYSAWRRGAIEITEWHGIILPLGSQEARLYLAPQHNPRQLRKMSQRLNSQRPSEEWLYSHPSFGKNSTPTPCFIQQDRRRLEEIRKVTTI